MRSSHCVEMTYCLNSWRKVVWNQVLFCFIFLFSVGIFHDFYLLEKQMAVAILKHVIKKIQYRNLDFIVFARGLLASIPAWIHTRMESILIMCNQCRGTAIKHFLSALISRKNSEKQKGVLCSVFLSKGFFLINDFLSS